MGIGDPIRCYPFQRLKQEGFFYLPYDKTEFELSFRGDKEQLKPITNYWISIGKPKYDSRKSMAENMQTVFAKFNYWPEPLLNKNIIETLLLEYDEADNLSFHLNLQEDQDDYFGMRKDLEKKSKEKEPEKELFQFDDEIPF
tara:strand:- start:376 stop:801 length:426 start_codon:yes stop_codon:yes gene_type:complete